MATKKLLGFVKKGWQKFVDPEADQRVEEACKHVRAGLKKYRKEFVLTEFVKRLEVFDEDLTEIQRQVYLVYVERVWDDLVLTEKEETTLDWIARALEICDEQRKELHDEYGRDVFAKQLLEAVADGKVSDEENVVLKRTAEWMGMSLRELTKSYFAEEGESFLRMIFLGAIDDGALLEREWDYFLSSASNLGFTRLEHFTNRCSHIRHGACS